MDHTGINEFFHALAACSCGMEHQRFAAVVKHGADLLHAGRGHAEHGHADDLAVVFLHFYGVGGHAHDGVGGIAQNPAGNHVEALNIHNGGHHADVRRPHVGSYVAGGHGGYHDFGKAYGKTAHAAGDESGVAGTAKADDAVHLTLMFDKKFFQQGTHFSEGLAAIVDAVEEIGTFFSEAYDGAFKGRKLPVENTYVDDARFSAQFSDDALHVADFRMLRITCSNDENLGHVGILCLKNESYSVTD